MGRFVIKFETGIIEREFPNREKAKSWAQTYCPNLFILDIYEVSVTNTQTPEDDYGIDWDELFGEVKGEGIFWRCWSNKYTKYLGTFEGTKMEVCKKLRKMGFFKAKIKPIKKRINNMYGSHRQS